jgi:hypothetical protein
MGNHFRIAVLYLTCHVPWKTNIKGTMQPNLLSNGSVVSDKNNFKIYFPQGNTQVKFVLQWLPSWISKQPKNWKHCKRPSNGYSCRVSVQYICGKYILKLFFSDTTEPFDSKFGCIVPLMFVFHGGWKYKIDQNIVRDHPMVIHVEFRFNIFNFWFSIWSREESLSSDSDQNEQPPLTSNYWTQKRPQHMALEIQIQRN